MATAITTGSIDVNGIVSQLMSLEQRPLAALQRREAANLERITALGRFQGALSALQSAAQAVARPDAFAGRRANVSGDALTATASNSALAGSYAVEVMTLAQAQALASAPLATDGASVGTGRLTIQLGRYDNGSFIPRSGGSPTQIVIGAGQQSLAQVRDAINAAGAGVTASIVASGQQRILTITPNATGADNAVRIGVADDDGNDHDAAGLSRLAFDATRTAGAGSNLTETRPARDAAFKVNGLTLSSGVNTVDDAIQGVTLTLAREGATATVGVTRDTAGARSAINAFVRAYTDFDKTARELLRFDPQTRAAGPLNGDSAARNAQQAVARLFRGAVSGASANDFTELSNVGIEIQRDGTVNVNAPRLEAALVADPDKVGRLFAANQAAGNPDSGGVARRLANLTTAMLGNEGQISARTRGLQSTNEQLRKQQQDVQRKLEVVETRLRREYSRLDAELNRMQGVSSSLANALRGLSGRNDN